MGAQEIETWINGFLIGDADKVCMIYDATSGGFQPTEEQVLEWYREFPNNKIIESNWPEIIEK